MGLNSLTKGLLATTVLVGGLGVIGTHVADAAESNEVNLNGKVALDLNNNGKYDSKDKLLKGTTIEVFNKDGKLVKSVNTGKVSTYSIKGISKGVYKVEVTNIVNGVDTTYNYDIKLDKTKTQDFLFGNDNIITGTVYKDLNKNKSWDIYKEVKGDLVDYEPALKGIKVQLLDKTGKVIETVNSTGKYGDFKFKYFGDFKGKTVKVVEPNNFKATTNKEIKINTNDVEEKEFEFGLINKK